MAENQASRLEAISRLVQVLSVVAGVAISVFSFNQARVSEANAGKIELEKRQIEASKPFLELRQKRYMEAVEAASVLATPDVHNEEELSKARKRFLELYWGELSMVEDASVESKMVEMAWSLNLIQKEGEKPDPKDAVYRLSHTIRDSLLDSWGAEARKVGEINQ